MALPNTGPISLNDVNVELGNSGTAQIDMGSAAVRNLFGVASGAISMSDGYGKSSQFTFTISTNQTDADLRALAVTAGWDQSSVLVATIGAGVIISGSTTTALTVSGSFPSGVTLVNNGVIVGYGGAGGKGAGPAYTGPSGGSTGGTALAVSSAITIQNNGTIAGGGGGGGGGGRAGTVSNSVNYPYRGGGGGGGGGGRSSAAVNSAGGGRGTWSSNGYNGSIGGVINNDAAGNDGTYNAAGNGGVGGVWQVIVQKSPANYTAGTGGNGGNWGAGGNTGGTGSAAASYNNHSPVGYFPGASGGGGGSAVTGNSNITWSATGTRYGGIA